MLGDTCLPNKESQPSFLERVGEMINDACIESTNFICLGTIIL